MAFNQHFDSPQQANDDLLRVCRIGKAQGLKGEVTVRIFTDEPEKRFASGAELYSADGTTRYVVSHARTFKNRWILLLEGVNDRNAAEALNGVELYVLAEDREELASENEWYIKDLVGLEARLCEGNALALPARTIGKIVDVIDGGQTLLKIRLTTTHSVDGMVADGKVDGANNTEHDEDDVPRTALVPFVEALVPEVNVAGGYVTLDPPGGLIPGL